VLEAGVGGDAIERVARGLAGRERLEDAEWPVVVLGGGC
jgi:hypothetical protein